MSLTDAQVAHYQDHGYVSPIDVFTEDEASAIKEEFEQAGDVGSNLPRPTAAVETKDSGRAIWPNVRSK